MSTGSEHSSSQPVPRPPVFLPPQPSPYPPPYPPGYQAVPPAQPAAPVRRIGWPGVVALVLSGLLLGVAGWQAYQIQSLSSDLRASRAALSSADANADRRTTALEQQAAGQFDSQALAAKALPAVFRVRAGDYFGSAFAIGKPAADGGTNLFTNFHVIEQVWNRGDRDVKLEHADQLFEATIVAGDKKADIAQLHTKAKIEGLQSAADAAKSGQPILVVGAPHGLKDTVTSGVVSAFRDPTSDHGPFIQFDAAINPGNSGGPVINAQAQVIGIASAKFVDSEGLALAIPIKIACDKYAIC